jgi:preprotein translocase subunit Sss1
MNESNSKKETNLPKILLAGIGGILVLGCAGFVVYILVVYAGKFG